jgi:hypothetical protein
MNWLVYFWYEDELIIIGQYNNYDLESGYMEYSITARIKRMFPEAKLHRDNAGMIESINGENRIHIMPHFVV